MFGFIGMILTGAILHENLHRFDFRNIDKISEEVCYLDSNIEGYYKVNPKAGQDEEVDNIKKYWEYRAYGVTFFILMIFIVSFFITFKYILNSHRDVRR